MAKILVKGKGKIKTIISETYQERQDKMWLEKYQLCVEFIKTYGHQKFYYQVPNNKYDKKFNVIRVWVTTQRVLFRKGLLIDWRLNLLEKARIIWYPFDHAWNNSYLKLLEFKKKYGHCDVSRGDQNYRDLSMWVGTQRHKKSKLSNEKLTKLNEIGFNWGYSLEKWDDMYESLKTYYEHTGICYVSQGVSRNSNDKRFKGLSDWCKKQIWLYHKNQLPKDRIEILKSINFDFEFDANRRDKLWNEKYLRLIEYQKKFGNCNVPNRWKEDYSLGRWVERMKEDKDKLSADKIKKLDDLGFIWSHASELWDRHIVLLKNHFEKYGNCDINKSMDKSLTNWILYLRKLKRNDLLHRLTDQQIQELNKYGIKWEYHKNLWDNNYQLLVEFKKFHGHCVVPDKPRSKLANWIKYLRNRKNTDGTPNFEPEKIKLLNDLGFDWKPFETRWHKYFKLLVDYKNEHGNCLVKSTKKDINLWYWTNSQRKNKSKLSQEKISKLNELGFEW